MIYRDGGLSNCECIYGAHSKVSTFWDFRHTVMAFRMIIDLKRITRNRPSKDFENRSNLRFCDTFWYFLSFSYQNSAQRVRFLMTCTVPTLKSSHFEIFDIRRWRAAGPSTFDIYGHQMWHNRRTFKYVAPSQSSFKHWTPDVKLLPLIIWLPPTFTIRCIVLTITLPPSGLSPSGALVSITGGVIIICYCVFLTHMYWITRCCIQTRQFHSAARPNASDPPVCKLATTSALIRSVYVIAELAQYSAKYNARIEILYPWRK